MSLNDAHFVKKDISSDLASNFELLLEQAIALTQQFSSHAWTDYNLHDPGITILEQVCFAITDLAYKTDFPIEDLLTDEKGNISRKQNAFFEKEKVLTCNPITVNDLRKVILDEFHEVDNVMLLPVKSRHTSEYLKGLYHLVIRLNNSHANSGGKDHADHKTIEQLVMNCFLDKRNVSEDLCGCITTLEPQKIMFSADIIIRYNTSPEEVLANIINSLESLLNPKVTGYSEKELLHRGMPPEEIYSGPLLKNGFIPDEALKTMCDTIDPIELANVISQVEGVIFVKKLLKKDTLELDGWKPIKLDKGYCPAIDITYFVENVKLITDDYIVPFNRKLVYELISRTEQLGAQRRKVYLPQGDAEYIRLGNYRNAGNYHSLQNNFPTVFGIGDGGLSIHESDERKAAARQLKAYLLFFEQIMANYLAQLENISRFYSTLDAPRDQHSYFHQPLYNIPRIEELLSAFTSSTAEGGSWDDFMANRSNDYIKALDKAIETPETRSARKERVVDHLLARFNVQVNGLPALLYFNLYRQGNNREKAQFMYQWKGDILKHHIENSYNKVKAFNYLDNDNQLSGFEKNVAMYLHLRVTKSKRLSAVFETGNIAFVAERTEMAVSSAHHADIISTEMDGVEIEIISGSDEVFSLGNLDKLIVGGIVDEYGYIFRYQSIDVLKHGIRLANYKIVCPSGFEFLIIYKAPLDEKWTIIGRRLTKQDAILSLKKLVAYLKKISIQSEGFHMMEHLLLRPEVHLPAFGFRFLGSSGETLVQNHQWCTFQERESFLDWMLNSLDLADGTDEKYMPPLDLQLKVLSRDGVWEIMEGKDFFRVSALPMDEERHRILNELKKLNNNKTSQNPRFDFRVKLPNDAIMEEAFYNHRVTIVLPKWPARFQDNEFRLFCENLFRSLAPAYLRLEFCWLGIIRMKKFEDLYFELFDKMKLEGTLYPNRFDFSVPMTEWLDENCSKKYLNKSHL